MNPAKRLGAKGIEEIIGMPFFSKINWEGLILKKIEPPLKLLEA